MFYCLSLLLPGRDLNRVLPTLSFPWAHVGGLSVHQCTLTDHPMLMKNCESRVLGSQSGSQKEQHQSIKFTVPEILHVSWLHIKSKSQSHQEGETCDLLLVMQHCYPAPLCTQRNQERCPARLCSQCAYQTITWELAVPARSWGATANKPDARTTGYQETP